MKSTVTFLAALIITAFLPAMANADSLSVKTYSVEGEYADVLQDLEDGILDAGLNIDYRGRIGEMLERTRKDLGGSETIYKGARFMQFCSARLSRQMMLADPANMGVCPYKIFLYETVKKPGTVVVGYQRPLGAPGKASQKVLGEIEALLDGIVKEATDN